LGVGIGLTVGSKFVGAIYIFPGIFVAALGMRSSLWMSAIRTLLFLLVLAITFIVINGRAFESFVPLKLLPGVMNHVKAQVEEGLSGQKYVVLPTPNAFALRIVASDVMPHLWLLTLGASVICIMFPRRSSQWSVVLTVFASVSIIAMSFCSIPFPRYALPVTFCLYVSCAAAICSAIERLPATPLHRTAVVGVVLVVIVAAQGWRCRDFDEQFRDDSRQRLREWVARNIPAGSTIVADGYARLDGPGDPIRFPLQSVLRVYVGRRFLAAEAKDSLDVLAQSGVRYVVVAAPAYERFFAKGVRAAPGYEDEFERCRRFYSELFTSGQLIWASIPSPATRGYTNPELRLYQIADKPITKSN
jgi:4-amino-4-deoxy-L-arabinose transferase-like glycosyltransferase